MSTVPVRQPLSSTKKTLSAVPSPAPKPKQPEPLQLPVQQNQEVFRMELWQHIKRSLCLASDAEHAKKRKSSPMFIFVRELMRFNLPQNLRDDPNAFADLLEELYHEWRNKQPQKMKDELDSDFWSQYDAELKNEWRAEFLATWDNMADPPSADPLLAAKALVWTDPMMNNRIPGKSMEYVELLVMAKQLQLIVGDQNILLPQDRLAEILYSSQPVVSRQISAAMRGGYLLLVRPHRYATNEAAEYRFLFERARRPEAKFPARKVN